MIAVWIILALVVVLVIYLVALYNRLVQKRNRVDNAWAQIEVQLKRRWDLIPNLVETVKGYAAHERGTFEAVTAGARAPQQGAGRRADGRRRGHPQPGARTAVRRRRGLPRPEGEHRTSSSSRSSCRTPRTRSRSRARSTTTRVLTYNNAIQVFPAVLLAGPFGFTKREFFEVEDAADREVPTVSFQPDAPGRPGSSPRRRCARATGVVAPPRGGARRARARGDRRREVVLAPAGRRLGAGHDATAASSSTSGSRTRSPGRSAAATATSRCARASRSTRAR